MPETGQRPNIYGFIINHNITDSHEPKPVQNFEQENALAKGRLESQGERGGWSRSMSLVWLLFLQWGRWGSKQILTFSRRDWRVYSPHSEALQLGLSIAGSGPNFGPWTWYSESVGSNSHVRPMWVIATCPFSPYAPFHVISQDEYHSILATIGLQTSDQLSWLLLAPLGQGLLLRPWLFIRTVLHNLLPGRACSVNDLSSHHKILQADLTSDPDHVLTLPGSTQRASRRWMLSWVKDC